jgi:hypothetical protein
VRAKPHPDAERVGSQSRHESRNETANYREYPALGDLENEPAGQVAKIRLVNVLVDEYCARMRPPSNQGSPLQLDGCLFRRSYEVVKNEVERNHTFIPGDRRIKRVTADGLDTCSTTRFHGCSVHVDYASSAVEQLCQSFRKEAAATADVDHDFVADHTVGGELDEMARLILDEFIVMKGLDLFARQPLLNRRRSL